MRRRGGITEWGSRTSHAESDPYLYPHHQTIDRLLSFHQSIEKFQTRRRRRKGTQKIRFVVVFFFFFSKMRWILLQSFVCVCVCVCNGHNGGAALCVCVCKSALHWCASRGIVWSFFFLFISTATSALSDRDAVNAGSRQSRVTTRRRRRRRKRRKK